MTTEISTESPLLRASRERTTRLGDRNASAGLPSGDSHPAGFGMGDCMEDLAHPILAIGRSSSGQSSGRHAPHGGPSQKVCHVPYDLELILSRQVEKERQ